MISSLSGTVLNSGSGWVVIGVGGIGLRVELPTGSGPACVAGDTLSLHTSLVVREDSLTLYGFMTEIELELFARLTSVSGVGPRLGLAVLSTLDPAEILSAVRTEDEKPFKQVSGIGPKTAKLMVLSLQGKLDGLDIVMDHGGAEGEGTSAGSADNRAAQAVVEGLVGLGWRESDAQLAVDDARSAGAPAEHSGLLRAALALLQAHRGGKS